MVFSPYISIVIPVCNEAGNIRRLFDRLYPVLRNIGKPFEIIFIDRGSRDDSLTIIRNLAALHPEVRVIELNADFGSQMAILAAFERAGGQIVVTMDADLRNTPEEIPRMVMEIERGRDMVGAVSQRREDSFFRRLVSHILNTATLKMTGVKISDYSGMLRAYHREVVNNINRCAEITTLVPALARTFCSNPVDIKIPFFERGSGMDKPSLQKLVRVCFDLMINFSVVPLRLITLCGVITSIFSAVLALVFLIRHIITFTEVDAILILLAVLLFFVGLLISAIGILGEYVGRIYQEVRKRPRFVIRRTYGFEKE